MSAVTSDCVISRGSKVISIALTGFSCQFTKEIKNIGGTTITMPQGGSETIPVKDMKYLDINKNAEIRFDIDGIIQTNYPDPATSADSSDDVMDKFDDIKAGMYAVGVWSMVLFGRTFSVFIDKFSLDYKPADELNVSTMTVKFTALNGVSVIGG